MTSLTVYIDEAGDPGVHQGEHYGDSRHEWMTLAACVIRSDRHLEPVEWVQTLRSAVCSHQSTSLHYAKVRADKRAQLCQEAASLPLRAFCIASHKSNMRDHVNETLGRMKKGDQFYNWCMRLLFERVTRWAEQWHIKEKTSAEPLSVIFAHRGGHDYGHMFEYFDRLRGQIYGRGPTLTGMGLREPFLVRDHWAVEPAEKVAGCQIADVIASAVYQGANAASPNWDMAPAGALRKILAKDRSGVIANMGVTVWPLPHQSHVPEQSRPFFRTFGYKI